MNNKNLKVGDKVFIKEGLVPGKYYGAMTYERNMVQGWCEVLEIFSKSGIFSVKTDNGDSWEFLYNYSPEMVDWEKTRRLKINESWESIKKEIRGDGTFKEITQCGESGNETTKAITHNGEEIIVKNNNEENDVEKAVMLLMLKSLGFTYSEIKKEVENVKVKWKPTEDDRYYYIREIGDVSSCFWNELSWDYYRFDFNNCFKTIEEAEEKLEKIKEVLKGE